MADSPSRCPHGRELVSCRACIGAAGELVLEALSECADIAHALASCAHPDAQPMLESPHVWCPDCGAFRLREHVGVWGIPKSVYRAQALEGLPVLRGVTAPVEAKA